MAQVPKEERFLWVPAEASGEHKGLRKSQSPSHPPSQSPSYARKGPEKRFSGGGSYHPRGKRPFQPGLPAKEQKNRSEAGGERGEDHSPRLDGNKREVGDGREGVFYKKHPKVWFESPEKIAISQPPVIDVPDTDKETGIGAVMV
ncbi:MAG: hypothetical protein ACYCYP_08170 [Leptospirales bacterium]